MPPAENSRTKKQQFISRLIKLHRLFVSLIISDTEVKQIPNYVRKGFYSIGTKFMNL